jgi:DNA-binding CsgD family transcriptional regulator
VIGELLTTSAGGAEPVGPAAAPDLRYRIVEELIDLVDVACSARPVVIVLEDIHWADDSTLLAVRSLAHRLSAVPLLIVVSLRPSPRSADLDVLLDDLLTLGARHVRLDALSAEAVTALARARLGAAPGPGLAATLRKAAGNPLLVVETLRSRSDAGHLVRRDTVVETDASDLPVSLRELVIRRLHYLPEPTRDLLSVASVLGDSTSLGELAAVAGLAPTQVVPRLAVAFRAGLLVERGDDVVFRHHLVHDAIHQDMPAPVRRALHRAAAETLREMGADELRVADHLVLGAERGDLEAVVILRRAAREAVTASPGVTVELLRRAESLLPAQHADADLIASELVGALLRAGRITEAAARAEAALGRSHQVEADLPLQLALISALSLLNRPRELIDRSASFLDDGALRPPSARALVLAQASLGHTLGGDPRSGEAAARQALGVAEEAGDASMIVWSLVTLSAAVKSQGRYAEAVDAARRAVREASDPASPEARLRHPLFFLGMTLCDSDRFDEAQESYARALAEYDDLGSVWLLSDTILHSAIASFISGRWDEAEAGFETGSRVAEDQGVRIGIVQARALQSVAATARGDLVTAERVIEPYVADLAVDTFGGALVAHAASLVAEATGDLSRAFDLLRHQWQLQAAQENRYFHRWNGPVLVRLALALDIRDVAADVAAVVEQGSTLAPDVPSVVAAALRCRGMVDDDAEAMLSAVRHARESGRVLEGAGCCEDAARVLLSQARTEEAVEVLDEALHSYEGLGASAWAARVAMELRRLGVRPGVRGPRQRPRHGWQSLTAGERAVARLVAEGLTNLQVAQRLFISPHTVSTHLRHTFEKLGVANRAALAVEAGRAGRAGE